MAHIITRVKVSDYEAFARDWPTNAMLSKSSAPCANIQAGKIKTASQKCFFMASPSVQR